MKKIKIFLIIFIVFIVGSSIILAKTGTTTTDGINLRNKPSTNSDIIRSIAKNESLEILEESGDFYKVLYSGRVGYVSKKFVNISNGSQSTSSSNTTSNVTNTIDEINTTNTTSSDNTINTSSTSNENMSNSKSGISIGNYKLNGDGDVYVVPVLYSLKTGSLKNGNTVNVTAVTPNWVYISNNNISGWMFKSLISENSKINETNVTGNPDNTLTVNTDSVNIRKRPTTSSDVIGSVNRGKKLQVISKSDDWTQVQFNNVKGYILSRFLS